MSTSERTAKADEKRVEPGPLQLRDAASGLPTQAESGSLRSRLVSVGSGLPTTNVSSAWFARRSGCPSKKPLEPLARYRVTDVREAAPGAKRAGGFLFPKTLASFIGMRREIDMATVVVGGDICPIERNRTYFKAGYARNLFNDLLPEFVAAHLTIANLECPLFRKPFPIPKTEPTFGEDGDYINGIREAGIHGLGLANNHILGHEAAGLENTMAICADAGI